MTRTRKGIARDDVAPSIRSGAAFADAAPLAGARTRINRMGRVDFVVSGGESRIGLGMSF